ncbi:MerR family DNA-binding protein [Amycolatopsis viridis]|uniref:DNA-binding transcriptional MerR regulator n=1 Tax=Amycolatopsis viridis TaxID=185678 RepID=A0ABX0SM31_9PSEU|nr:MerR family DNA-binding protein [Amycolatopsis viridis]NIH78031.1 DNA-binding transcriptional MerR regulator [Amycolatopsis viridis]
MLGRVRNIRLLLAAGLTADDVRALLGCLDEEVTGGPICPASARVVARRLAAVEDKIAALDVVRARLTAALSAV